MMIWNSSKKLRFWHAARGFAPSAANTSTCLLLTTEEENWHDPSVGELVSKVIKADKMDHLGLINHSPLMPESSPTPFVGYQEHCWACYPFPLRTVKMPLENNCNKSDILNISPLWDVFSIVGFCLRYCCIAAKLDLNIMFAFNWKDD